MDNYKLSDRVALSVCTERSRAYINQVEKAVPAGSVTLTIDELRAVCIQSIKAGLVSVADLIQAT